jgi:hypothetical protein
MRSWRIINLAVEQASTETLLRYIGAGVLESLVVRSPEIVVPLLVDAIPHSPKLACAAGAMYLHDLDSEYVAALRRVADIIA